MSAERIFLDTVFIQALIDKQDDYHSQAQQLFPRIRNALLVLVTEAILLEVAGALRNTSKRSLVVPFINQLTKAPNVKIVSIESQLFKRGLELYNSRPDKNWSLTDCISFIVMEDNNLTDVMSLDRDFVQAGFNLLMKKTK